MQNTPRVTHGKVLCKRELLEGNPVINHVLHKTSPCIYLTIVLSWEDLCKSDFGDVPAH